MFNVMAPSPATTRSTTVGAQPAIAGFTPTGTLDWPGRVAATILLGGCNLRCPYCSTPELVSAPRRQLALDEALTHLSEKRAWLDGVVVSGGEPLRDPALSTLLRELRARRIPIKLDTNGSDSAVLRRVLESGLVDYVALDVKTLPQRYDRATRVRDLWPEVQRSIQMVIASGVDHEFRTTCYPLAVETADLPAIASHLSGGRRYVLQQFRPQRTLDPGAATVRPHSADALHRAAMCCSIHIPTTVRGA